MNLDEILDSTTWKLALQRWPVFLLTLVLTVVAAVVACGLIPHKYRIIATIIGTRYENDIIPNDQSVSIAAVSLLGGGGNDLPTITDFRLFSELFISPELGAVIKDDPVIHRVFWRQWDKDHWVPPDTFAQRVANVFMPLIGQKPWHPPDGFTVKRWVQSHVTLAMGKDAKIATITSWNVDPELGKDLIVLLCTRADDMVRNMAQKRFRAKVAFLEKALSEATVEENRRALGAALAKAETGEIYSFSNLPFAAEFVGLPSSPSAPEFPNFGIVLAVCLGVGNLLFLAYIVLLRRNRDAKEQKSPSRAPVVVAAQPRARTESRV